MTALTDREQAESEGYTVDHHCYPWIAYKGPRFNPTIFKSIRTDDECNTSCSTAAADRQEIVALGDLVTVNELSPYFADWRWAKLKVVGLHLAPDGGQWADVIEGDQRHRGNGIYDGETDGFNVLWLSKCAAIDGGRNA